MTLAIALSGDLVGSAASTRTNSKSYSSQVLSGLCTFVLVAFAIFATSTTAHCGIIFVANAGNGISNGTIGEYTTSGATVNAALISGLAGPEGIAVSGGHLFVANAANGTIGEYTTSGATVNPALISGLTGPIGIALSGGHLFVVNGSGVGEYTTSGALVNPTLVSGLFLPIGIAISGTNLFVTDTNGTVGTVGKYTTSGATVNAALISSTTQKLPEGIAVSGGNLFVGDTFTNTISEYDATTGAPVNSPLISSLSGPNFLTLSGGNLFVTNFGNGTIGEYTTSGATVNASLVSGLNVPRGIVIVSGSVPDASSTWTLLLLGLIAMVSLKHMLRQPV